MKPLILFSEPYKKSVLMNDCEKILMMTSEFEIAALLSYLKQLIHSYNACEVHTC